MAILPPAKPTARSLASIDRSYEIRRRPHERRDTPDAWRNRNRRRRSRSGQLLDAVIWGAALGAASGAVLGDAIDGVGAGPGAVIGAAVYAPAEVITSIRRGAGKREAALVPHPQQRPADGGVRLAVGADLSSEPLFIAIVSGALIGLLGLRPGKALLGLLVGFGLGALFQALDGALEPALVAAAVTLTYRVIAAIAYRGRRTGSSDGQGGAGSELRYVVPFEARSRYVGGDYVEQLAKARGGTFRRNPPMSGSWPRWTACRDQPSMRAGSTR